jgi:hypothetical protein
MRFHVKLLAIVFVLISTAIGSVGFASSGLTIHATEFGVGKFHRYDNHVHAYSADNAWVPYILPDTAPTDKPLVRKNADGSFTVFFSTLDEMMASVAQIANQEGNQVSVLNVHGHGLPGAMWFPKDAAEMSKFTCADWVQAATGSDVDNYNQYYSAISVAEVLQFRQMSNNPKVKMGCTTGADEWREGAAKNPSFKTVFASDAQIHFLSCIVGLGTVGDAFTKSIAEIVLPKGSGHVETSMAFGLGDWSMPQGMGFWDYLNDSQLNRDNSVYPVDRKDAEVAQKGSIRVASLNGAQWGTSVLANRDHMGLSFEIVSPGVQLANPPTSLPTIATGAAFFSEPSLPNTVRVPGTNSFVSVEAQ